MFTLPFLVEIAIIYGTKLALAEKVNLPTDYLQTVGSSHAAADGNSADANAPYLDDADFTCYNATKKCYKVMYWRLRQFPDALQYCLEGMDATLVSIHSKAEFEQIMDLIDSQIPAPKDYQLWIGMQLKRHRQAKNRIIAAIWWDGTPVDYGNPVGIVPGTSPWANIEGHPPEPNNGKGNEDCVQIRRAGWVDHYCDEIESGFICQKLIKSTPVVTSTVRSFPDDDRDW